MPRVQPKHLNTKEKDDLLNEFWSLMIVLETKEEIENFFQDLLSETEAIMLARRVRIARFLLEGRGYDEIGKLLHASPGTIAGVHSWLQGHNREYAQLLPKLEKEVARKRKQFDKERKQREYGSFEWLKKRYPLHFLLFNLIDLKDQPRRRRKRR